MVGTIATYIVYDNVTRCFGHKPLSGAMSFLNDPLERQKVLVFGESSLRPTPRLSTWKTTPPRENVASVVTFTAFYQDIPALSIWWLSPFHLAYLISVPTMVCGPTGSA